MIFQMAEVIWKQNDTDNLKSFCSVVPISVPIPFSPSVTVLQDLKFLKQQQFKLRSSGPTPCIVAVGYQYFKGPSCLHHRLQCYTAPQPTRP
jgi:hypothetical protein